MTSIAIMNAKGGVGKSTITLGLAETFVVKFNKRVLAIDSDAQATLTSMLCTPKISEEACERGCAIVAWLRDQLIGSKTLHWTSCLLDNASDVDDARALSLLPGDMDLTLLERKISDHRASKYLRHTLRTMLNEANHEFDLVLIDCAPGMSLLTEGWLREADYHLVPLKPDPLSLSGMHYLQKFKERDQELGFSELLATVVNMKHHRIASEQAVHSAICGIEDLRGARNAIPNMPHLQKSALYDDLGRSYQNKYPGAAGEALECLATELLGRIDLMNAREEVT